MNDMMSGFQVVWIFLKACKYMHMYICLFGLCGLRHVYLNLFDVHVALVWSLLLQVVLSEANNRF